MQTDAKQEIDVNIVNALRISSLGVTHKLIREDKNSAKPVIKESLQIFPCTSSK